MDFPPAEEVEENFVMQFELEMDELVQGENPSKTQGREGIDQLAAREQIRNRNRWPL